MMCKDNRLDSMLSVGIIISILVACSGSVPTATPFAVKETRTPFPIISTINSNKPTSTSTSSPMTLASPTPLPATETQQVWFATAKAIDASVNAATQRSRDQMATQAAQFPPTCENDYPINEVSPDGKWLATSCGYKRDQTMIVQNKDGIKWVLEFKDFLSPVTVQSVGGIPMGSLYPKFWSPDGSYLYFISVIGYDGGGTECFSYFMGDYGLFRLDLKKGAWSTLIPPTDNFPGYGVQFSPTGRRYAVDINGITITDLKSGMESNINLADGVEGFIWSPDGTQLAFTIASCDEEQGTVLSSSVYVWDALKNEKRILFTTNEMVLRPEEWIDNSTFRISGDKFLNGDMVHTIYVFDVAQNSITFTGTATPNP